MEDSTETRSSPFATTSTSSTASTEISLTPKDGTPSEGSTPIHKDRWRYCGLNFTIRRNRTGRTQTSTARTGGLLTDSDPIRLLPSLAGLPPRIPESKQKTRSLLPHLHLRSASMIRLLGRFSSTRPLEKSPSSFNDVDAPAASKKCDHGPWWS